MTRLLTLLLLVTAYPAGLAEGAQHRSRAVLVEFQKLHPCPSTGRKTGPCPGWQKDHVTALVCGGADSLENLAWITVADHKLKTAIDIACCRKPRSGTVLKVNFR